ncbi:MAG: hypothetical protein ACI8PB_001767 [Desulforhopalus sp.]|jgi:hypothetical protein
MEKIPESEIVQLPTQKWNCQFHRNGIDVNVNIRIGRDWWEYLGGETCLVELFVALIRACVIAGESDPDGYAYKMSDLSGIVDTSIVPAEFNVAILQRSQLAWFFFLAKHFCDDLVNA